MTTQDDNQRLANAILGKDSPEAKSMRQRKPLFACMECGKKFYSAKAAEKASFGDSGCPGCGGSDIDSYLERDAQ